MQFYKHETTNTINIIASFSLIFIHEIILYIFYKKNNKIRKLLIILDYRDN